MSDSTLTFRTSMVLCMIVILISILTGLGTSMISNTNNPSILALIPLGLLVTIYVFLHPKIGLFIVIFLLAVVPPAPKEIGLVEIAYLVIFASTFGGWIAKKGWQRIPATLTRFSVTVIVIMAMSSLLTAIAHGISISLWVRGIIPFAGLLLFFVSGSILNTSRDREQLIWVFYITTIVLIVVSFRQGIASISTAQMLGNFWIVRENLGFGAYQPLIIGIPLFACGYLFENPRKRLWFHYFVLIVSITASLLTLLRSVFIVIGLCLFVALWLYARTHTRQEFLSLLIKLVLVLCLTSGVVMISQFRSIFNLFTSGVQVRFGQLTEEDFSQNARILEFNEVKKYFLESPLLGKGLGFQYEFIRGYMGYWRGGYTHNIISYFALTMGTVGILALFGLLFTIYKDLWAKLSNHRSYRPEDRAFLMAAILYIVALLLYVQFQSVFRHVSFFTTLSIMLGAATNLNAVTALDKGSKEEDSFTGMRAK